MRPDLFKAVVAQVPFVDVINTMLDASLPLTTSEYIEWGNPNEKPAFDYMMSYSPYDNVKAQAYPGDAGAGLAERQPGAVLGGREVRRQAARDEDRQERPAAEGEHGRRPRRRVGRYDALREPAFTYSFMLWQMGVPIATTPTAAHP